MKDSTHELDFDMKMRDIPRTGAENAFNELDCQASIQHDSRLPPLISKGVISVFG